MERWSSSLQFALRHPWTQAVVALAFLVPLVATGGQYWASGYWTQSTKVTLLFWPGVEWSWGVWLPVWLSMGAMLASYVAGVGYMVHKRTFGAVVLIALGAIIAANIPASVINNALGWRETQTVGTLQLAGKANRAIFALWHNPAWEELVFRGIPLVLLLGVRRWSSRTPAWAVWCYYLVPSVIFAWYHVPGHGPSRIVDTFILSLVFGWTARHYTFFAPLVTHYVYDAVMVMSLSKLPNIPTVEVAWLADHFTILNSTWTILTLVWVASLPVLVLLRRRQVRRAPAVVATSA